MDWGNLSVFDYERTPLRAGSEQLRLCQNALARRQRRGFISDPPLHIDPLSPLPLADAAPGGPAVRLVYFIMASRSYAHETINRNMKALQRPGVLSGPPSNESNLFLLHIDAKMSSAADTLLRSRLLKQPDVYLLRRPRHVMWAGYSMMLALLDTMASLVARRLRFDMLINFSDADLTLRTDGEIRAFFARFPGRSVMSIVQRNRDPRRYRLHENFRRFCWVRLRSPPCASPLPTPPSLPCALALLQRACMAVLHASRT